MIEGIEVALAHERREAAEKRLEQACDEINDLKALVKRQREQIKLIELESDCAQAALQAYEERAVEGAFWKSAAERALRLWDAEAEKNEKLLDGIETALSSPSTALSKENWHRLETLLDE